MKIDSVQQRLMVQRTQLVLREPFYGSLALRLRLVEDWTCETMWVDGTTMGYNPQYVTSLTDAKLRGLMCHEVLHVAAGHCWRRAGRDPGDWNDACDYAINPVLEDAKFELPEDALQDSAYRGLCAEQIYEKIHRPKQPGASSTDTGNGDHSSAGQATPGIGNATPSKDSTSDANDGASGSSSGAQAPRPRSRPAGEVREPRESVSRRELQGDWSVAVNHAMRMAGRGELPGDLKRLVEEGARPVVDWRSVMRQFVQTSWTADDYTWRLPSPRFIAHELYLPRPASERIPCLVFFIDTSGSIYGELLSAFIATVKAIAEETKAQSLYIVYCDAKVQRVDQWEAGDDITFEPTGGGGTNFRPAFEWAERQQLALTCAVFLTDLDGYFPEHPPGYPVLWVAPPSRRRPPWGEYVELRD